MESHSVTLGLVPVDTAAEFQAEFESRFNHQCKLRPAANGQWLGVYGRRRWPSGQHTLMRAFTRAFVARNSMRSA